MKDGGVESSLTWVHLIWEDTVPMNEKEKTEIKTERFMIEGYPYSITYIPDGDKIKIQIMNEDSYRIHYKGEV